MVFHLGSAQINLLLLGVLGFAAGVLSGFFGVGGGFVVSPALNTLGVPMGLAIGTALAQTLGTSAIGSFRHRKMGNVDFKLGMIFILSMVPSVEIGKRFVMGLTKIGMAGDVVRYVFIALLTGLGIQMLRSYFANHGQSAAAAGHKSLLALLPPRISLRGAGTEGISIWVFIGLGLGVGVLSGFLGVGGGFILVPVLCMMGIPDKLAVGTSCFTILLGSGTYGTFTYGLSNEVSFGAALVMLLGASLGAQVGARATVHADVRRFRFLFAILLLLMALSVVLKQASAVHGWSFSGNYSAYLLLSAAIGMSLFITGFLVLSSRGDRRLAVPIDGSRATGFIKRVARRVDEADLMSADAILKSKDWPHLWRK